VTGCRRFWSLVVVTGIGFALAPACAVDTIEPASGTECRVGDVEILSAQTAPSASYIPCIAGGLEAWRVEATEYTDDGTSLHLVTADRDGTWTVELADSCEPGSAPSQPPIDRLEGELFRHVDAEGDRYRETSYYEFDGGCVVSDVDLSNDRSLDVVRQEQEDALAFVARDQLAAEVERRTDGRLTLDPE
jgi:hypothetical protein